MSQQSWLSSTGTKIYTVLLSTYVPDVRVARSTPRETRAVAGGNTRNE